MTNKTKILATRVLSTLLAVVLLGGGAAKIMALAPIVSIYAERGLVPYLPYLGISEILFLVVFLWHRTLRIGLLLLTGYFGGAIATELTFAGPIIAPIVLLCVIWLLAYWRDAVLFAFVQSPTPNPR